MSSFEDPFAVIGRHLFGEAGKRGDAPVTCYAALGDSFTAGSGCDTGERWADRIAASLRARNPQMTYRNLAEDGAPSEVVLEQVGPAIQLEPDLVTVVCGANDVLLKVRPDVRGYADRLSQILDRLRLALPRVAIVTATTPEGAGFMELGRRTRARVVGGLRDVNAATRAVSAQRRVPCVDVVDHPGLADRTNFAADGLHPSPAGHESAAREFARTLRASFGIETGI